MSIFSGYQRISLPVMVDTRARGGWKAPHNVVVVAVAVAVAVVIVAVRLRRRQDALSYRPANGAQVHDKRRNQDGTAHAPDQEAGQMHDWRDQRSHSKQQSRVHARATVKPLRIIIIIPRPAENQAQRERAEDVGYGRAHDVADSE